MLDDSDLEIQMERRDAANDQQKNAEVTACPPVLDLEIPKKYTLPEKIHDAGSLEVSTQDKFSKILESIEQLRSEIKSPLQRADVESPLKLKSSEKTETLKSV